VNSPPRRYNGTQSAFADTSGVFWLVSITACIPDLFLHRQMTSSRPRFWVSLLVLALVVPACRKDDGGFTEALNDTYGPAFVGSATADATALEVTFLESPFADHADAERRVEARKVAEYVRDNYPQYKTLNKVIIAFPTKKELAAEKLSDIAARYTFTRAELGPPAP
jgi:hypothetical protein